MSYDFGAYQKDTLERARDKAWDNWAKFEKVGDKVQGYIRDVFYRKAEGDFKAQRGITLEQPDGVLVNVAIKDIPFILDKTDDLHLGDPLTVAFEEQKEPARKGIHGVKIYGYYGKQLADNAHAPTVKELYDIDKAGGGSEPEPVDEKYEAMTEGTGDNPF